MSKPIPFPAARIPAADPAPVALSIDEFIRVVAARQAAPITEQPAAAEVKPAACNKFGVKVGDIFVSSWGFEQTNVDFFQVVALVGKCSVRVREVVPPLVEENAIGPMAADRTYQVSGLPILPPVSSSIFIKDQERGDLKRLQSFDDVSYPTFKVSSYASAHLCSGETTTQYESWYY